MKKKIFPDPYRAKAFIYEILLNPEKFLGSPQSLLTPQWKLDIESLSLRIVNKPIQYIPALYSLFDQTLIFCGNYHMIDRKMDMIRVKIDTEQRHFKFWINSAIFPVEVTSLTGIYLPEIEFGRFKQEEIESQSPIKAYWFKIANIFSSLFSVEIGDSQNKKRFFMSWIENMTNQKQDSPIIEAYSGGDFTSITIQPDFTKFNIFSFDDIAISLFQKRVYDLAGILPNRISVELNGQLIPHDIRGFENYIDMYFEPDNRIQKIFELKKFKVSEKWDVVLTASEGKFQQVSFVNGICTMKGGSHVDYVIEQITLKIREIIKKEQPEDDITQEEIKPFIWLFISCTIDNPEFESISNDFLISKPENFGSFYKISDRFASDLQKSHLINKILLKNKTPLVINPVIAHETPPKISEKPKRKYVKKKKPQEKDDEQIAKNDPQVIESTTEKPEPKKRGRKKKLIFYTAIFNNRSDEEVFIEEDSEQKIQEKLHIEYRGIEASWEETDWINKKSKPMN